MAGWLGAMRFTSGPEVIAHRGASAHAPEHTIEAYDRAIAAGCDLLEIDVRMTADGRLAILHDATLARTAGDPRRVADLTKADLRALRTPPLGLRDVLRRYGDATRFLLDLKDPRPGMAGRIARAVGQAGLSQRVVVQSFDRPVLRRVARHDPEIATALLLQPWKARSAIERTLSALPGHVSGIGVWHQAIDARLVAAAHGCSLAVRAWTVNAPHEIERLTALGVDGIITDDPALARRVVDAPAVSMAA